MIDMKKSRAEYFRKRREMMGQFYVMIDKDMLEKLDIILKARKLSRTAWLKECIERELNNKGE